VNPSQIDILSLERSATSPLIISSLTRRLTVSLLWIALIIAHRHPPLLLSPGSCPDRKARPARWPHASPIPLAYNSLKERGVSSDPFAPPAASSSRTISIRGQ